MSFSVSLPRPRLAGLFGSLLLLALGLSACGPAGPIPSSWPGVTVAGDIAYVAYNQDVRAIRLNQPQASAQIWNFIAEGDAQLLGGAPRESFYGEPALLDGATPQLVASGYHLGRVYGLDPATGQRRWVAIPDPGLVASGLPLDIKRPAGNIVAGIGQGAGLVYAGLNNGTLLAIDPAANGAIRWTFKTDDESGFWSRPVFFNDRVYATSLGHQLFALDAATGVERAKFDAGAPIAGGVTITRELALFGTFNNRVLALDAATLAKRWEASVDGWVWGNPQVDGETVYVATLNGTVYALRLETGAELWHHALATDNPSVRAPLLVTTRTLYAAGSDGRLFALDRETGADRWPAVRIGLAENVKLLTQPLLWQSDKILIAITGVDQPLLQLRSVADGSELWSYKP